MSVGNNNINISVVIPVYRSEGHIYKTVQKIVETLKPHTTFEIILVDDCSPDDSWNSLLKVKTAFQENISIIRLSKNSGQHNATLCGFRAAKGDFIVTIDDDLQNEPSDILKLLEEIKAKQFDIVYGVYAEKQHSAFRNLGSLIIRLFYQMVFNTSGKGSSFRILKKNFLEQMVQSEEYFFNIDGAIRTRTKFIGYLLVNHHKRVDGASTYTLKKLFSMTFSLLFNYSYFPLRFISISGLLIVAFASIFGTVLIWMKFRYDVYEGYTSLMVSIIFSTGLMMTSLGIISEYLIRMYGLNKKTPQYTIMHHL